MNLGAKYLGSRPFGFAQGMKDESVLRGFEEVVREITTSK